MKDSIIVIVTHIERKKKKKKSKEIKNIEIKSTKSPLFPSLLLVHVHHATMQRYYFCISHSKLL